MKSTARFGAKLSALVLTLLSAGLSAELSMGVAQAQDPVQWTLSTETASAPAGTTVPFKLQATIQPGWHIYSFTIKRTETGPLPTVLKLSENPAVASFDVYQPKPEIKRDQTIEQDIEMFENSAQLWVPVKLAPNAKGDAKGTVEVTAEVRYSACDDRRCLRPVTKKPSATVNIDPAAAAPAAFLVPSGFANIKDDAAVAALIGQTASNSTPDKDSGASSVDPNSGAFLIAAFGFGLAAVFTPCVFPMIPITVSFFLNQRGGILQAIVFAAGIVIMFCGFALALTAIVGPFGVVNMSANPWVNGFIAAVFLTFSLSLLGAFEINLPSGLLTKMDNASRRSGFLGTLLMGLTFSLTSFACVGPFMGSLLASSMSSGNLVQPVASMASFATGLASPFFFLAAFPSYLKKMPKSGGWLARVKIVMGFVLLAVMLKYLSNVDQVLQAGWLTRERFLAAWVVLFSLAGLYLLGLLRLEGIEANERLSIGRLLAGSAFLIFAFSLLPGMFGATVGGELDAFVPVASQTSSLSGNQTAASPMWLKDSYQQALDEARKENKLVLVNFTGYTCTNCHWMKANMFPRPEVAAALNEFVRVELYTDGLDEASAVNQKLQERYNTIAQPFYVLMTPDEKVVATFEGSTRDMQQYLAFLKKRPA